jgi:hypothetical protein
VVCDWPNLSIPDTREALEACCADRPVPHGEVFEANTYYGAAYVVKRWAGVSTARPLKIGLPHGVEYATAMSYGTKELVPVVAVYCPDMLPVYHQEAVARVWLLAAPYVHVVAMAPPPPSQRKGSVFFPSHSTEHIAVMFDTQAVLRTLQELPAEFHPVTVCMFWWDVVTAAHHAYADAGLRVVSAGHPYDPLYFYRTHHICSTHRFALGNGLGSHVYYSIRSGCRFQPLSAPEATWTVPFSTSTDPIYRRALAGYRSLPRMTDAEQRAWADHYLGVGLLRTPDDTATLIRRADRLDRWGLLADRRTSARQNPLVIPPVYRRALRRVVRAVIPYRSHIGTV